MRSQLRCLLFACCTSMAYVAAGQDADAVQGSSDFLKIQASDLRTGTVEVPGQGRAVPGIALGDADQVRHMIGDSMAYAERAFVDTSWRIAEASADSIVPDVGIHWVRYRIFPDPDLKDRPLLLNVQAIGGFEVFLNGRSIVRSATLPIDPDTTVLRERDRLPHLTVPLTFACDGKPEVLSLRIAGSPGSSLSDLSLQVTLHASDNTFFMQRSMMHFGIFIGINIIILLFSLVIGWSERGERSWLFLAALSLVSILDTLCELGEDLGALGLTNVSEQVLGVVDTILTPWPMYLLIMVLGVLRGDLSRKRSRLYTIGVLVVTGICALAAVAERYGLGDFNEGVQFMSDAVWLIIPAILLTLLLASIVVWFAIEVVRLGIRLLRSSGYERWIGAGALAAYLFTFVIDIVAEFAGSDLSGFLSLLSDYCFYVAVPVSVAIYLAIRSVHHNKLVTRQRDELDEEVKERTSELRAEKERSDELLLNILPFDVAEELKETGTAAAKHFDQATVLFTDFRGFTQLSEQVSPAELVHELNTCFKAFDELMGKYRIEKIKTIGDSYMATGGLPDPANGSPADVVHAALDMQAFMRQHRVQRIANGLPAFEMRVGIHTGPVVAGIVGVKKFAYDIWGDTVNTASRMESSGEVGQVNISETTYLLIKDVKRSSKLSVVSSQHSSLATDNSELTTAKAFTFTPRGKIQVKGKGAMEMFFVSES